MAKYCTVFDFSDPSLVVTEDHCDSADVYVDAKLWEREIDPASVTLPHTLLSEIAEQWAKYLAADEGAIGEDSPLYKKASNFKHNAEMLANSLNRKALGLEDYTNFGNVTISRG